MVNTHQMNGGAARAAYRTFCAILIHRPKSRYLSLFKENKDVAVIGLTPNTVRAALAKRFAKLDQLPLSRYKHRIGTLFTPALYANPFRKKISHYHPRLLHLHWTGSGMLNIDDIDKIVCPIVWTLHDTWAFTGGCHYPGACDNYKKKCGQCPQLGSNDPGDLSQKILQKKSESWATKNITIVTPSRWMGEIAQQSSLFNNRNIIVIPNGLDTNTFKPIDRQAARNYLSIDDDYPVILFGAQNVSDLRKGGDLLCAALVHYAKPCTLLLFGVGTLAIEHAPLVTIRRLGNLNDDASLSLAYSAADVFACPSREDNLPNTIAEALACGTPCVAFNINGIPDMIEHMKTGWLAKPFDAIDLAAGITWLAHSADKQQLRHNTREKALNDYTLEVMGKRYAELYEELLLR
jgi:glycosyltransferase involved in cell wall biosynthesis